MTPRARWWLRQAGPALVWWLFAILFAVLGEWAAAIVCVGAGAVVVISARSAVWLFRSGYFLGRGTQLVDIERRARGLPTTLPRGLRPNPWDDFPAWPDEDTPADSGAGHTPRNAV